MKTQYHKNRSTRAIGALAALALTLLLSGCTGLFGGGDELYFELSAPAEVNSNQEFTVEVTNATLTDGGVFTWTFSGPGDVSFNGETVSASDETLVSGNDVTSVTLSAVTNGTYNVSLRVENDGSFWENGASVDVAGGAIELTGPITSDTELVDVVLEGADYIINSDLELSATLTLAGGNNRRIDVADGAGIIVKDGGTLRAGATTFGAGGSGWKGILVESGGTLDFKQVSIEGAAAAAFDSHKASALVFESGATVGPDFDTVSVKNTSGLNVYVEGTMTLEDVTSSGVVLFSDTPYDIPFEMLNQVQNRFYLDSSVGTTTGVLRGKGDTTVSAYLGGGSTITTPYQLDNYVVEGGLTLANNQALRFASGTTTVSFEAGTGLSLPTMLVNPSQDATVTLQGVDGASWEGVSVDRLEISSGDSLVIEDVTGAPVPVEGSEETAALIIDRDGDQTIGPDNTGIGVRGTLTIDVDVVLGTANYGLYESATKGPGYTTGYTSSTLTVSNATSAGISIFPDSLPILAGSVSITMPAASDQPAVELRERSGGNTDLSSDLTIPSLGTDNFYSVVGDPKFRFINDSGTTSTITFEDGVDMRFASGASLTIQGDTNDVAAFPGTSGNGIIFQPDGTLDAAGDWKGLYVDLDKITMDYTTVSGGGSAGFESNPQANLLVSGDVNDTGSFITNSTFRNSGGHGIVVASGSGAGFDDTDLSDSGGSNNSFTSNSSADDVVIQP